MHRCDSLRHIVASFFLLLLIASTAGAQIDYVIHVSVDGLGGPLFKTWMDSDTNGDFPNFKRFIDEGATTFNARTDFSYTSTLPNHATILTGRPVEMPAGQPNTTHHGYTDNSDPAPTATLHNSGNVNVAYIASVFDVAHDNGLTTALYSSKSKFIIYEQSYNAANGAPDLNPPDNGSDKIDKYLYLSTGSPLNASNMQAAFIADLAVAPANYSFVHYRDPDSAGHSFSWGSLAYRASVIRVDGYLGELFQTIENSAVLKDRTVVVLSSDHGGINFGHSGPTQETNYKIPFFAWGPVVDGGVDLYATNDGKRADPGTTRPDYNASPGPIRNGESANLALMLLGLPAVPGSSINSAQDLRLRAEIAVKPVSMSELKRRFR